MIKSIYNTYINTLTFYKEYIYLTTSSFTGLGYTLLLYPSTSVDYLALDIMLLQYNNSNIYKQNTSSYYYINIDKLDIGDGILPNSIHLTIDGTLYIDNNFTLFLSGTLNNCGNVIYDVGTIIITSQSVIDSIVSTQ